MTTAHDLPGLLAGAANRFARFAATDVVAARWTHASALSGYTVGGLVGHAVLGLAWTRTVVSRPVSTPVSRPAATDPLVLSLGEWFGQIKPGVAADNDGDRYGPMRMEAEAFATRGHGEVITALGRTTVRVDAALADADLDWLVSLEPVRPNPVPLADFLRTRLIELVVHADDLAASIDLTEAPVDPAALDVVLAALLDIGRAQHGDIGVLRAMTRGERGRPDVFPVL
jgi:hypothetical protein